MILCTDHGQKNCLCPGWWLHAWPGHDLSRLVDILASKQSLRAAYGQSCPDQLLLLSCFNNQAHPQPPEYSVANQIGRIFSFRCRGLVWSSGSQPCQATTCRHHVLRAKHTASLALPILPAAPEMMACLAWQCPISEPSLMRLCQAPQQP